MDNIVISAPEQPTVIQSFVNRYDHTPTVIVEPYRTPDRYGIEVLIREFQRDTGSGHIWAYGAKIRKDGQPANQHQILVGVTIPANVQSAMDALQ